MDIKVNGAIVTVTFRIDGEGTPSASGKSTVLATTRGNVTIPGTDVKLGLNAYR